MAKIKLQDGKVVTKDGKPSCECCGPDCPLGGACTPSGTNVVKAITSAQAAVYYAGGTWDCQYDFSINARLEGYNQFSTPNPYIAYETVFSGTANHSFAWSGCQGGTTFGPVATGNGTTVFFLYPPPPSSATQSSGDFRVLSHNIFMRKNPAGGYCLSMDASARSGYFGSSAAVHSKLDISAMTIEGTTATTGGLGCSTVTATVQNPVIVSAFGSTTFSASFTASAP